MGHNPPIDTILTLAKSKCFSVLSYGIASMPLSPIDVRYFTFAFNSLFCKLFKTNSVDIIEQCQYYTYCWPFYAYYDFLRVCFLFDKFKLGLLVFNNSFDRSDIDELFILKAKYKLQLSDSKYHIKCKMWRVIESTLTPS